MKKTPKLRKIWHRNNLQKKYNNLKENMAMVFGYTEKQKTINKLINAK